MAVSIPRYTVSDLDRFPDDGNRYELLDGVLLVTPAPRRIHQLVVSRLQMVLMDIVQRPGLGHVFAPGAVVLLPSTQLEPDILVQPGSVSTAADWKSVREHWLAVEVFSPSTRTTDRNVKCGKYFALGVAQVWLVDIEDQSVEVWTSASSSSVERESIKWRVPELAQSSIIDLAEIFDGTH